jgi:NitT/TauT family transport system ATP-binding protein
MIERAMQVPAVKIEGGEKIFGGRHRLRALADLELEIPDGQFVAILGPSGCGKSTLLNVIAGFESFTSGQALFFGSPISKPGIDRAVVFQEPALFPWLSVWENVVFSPKINGRKRSDYEVEARRYLRLVGLEKFAQHLPEQLSGGMKQRVGLARTLMMNPRIFLMDEPFGALDAQTRIEMQELLLHAWDELKRTVIFITHDIDEAIFLADVVYVMTARPGTMRSRIPIALERPRTVEMLTATAFNDLRRDILMQIREECRRARQDADENVD